MTTELKTTSTADPKANNKKKCQASAVRSSLKALIDAIVSVTGAQVQSTATLDPGQPATASVVLNGSPLRFTFGIPRWNDGAEGPPGEVTT